MKFALLLLNNVHIDEGCDATMLNSTTKAEYKIWPPITGQDISFVTRTSNFAIAYITHQKSHMANI